MTLLLAILMLLMTACAGATSSIHIPLVTYTVEVQKKAADELSAQGPACAQDAVTPACSATKRMVTDYGNLRKKVKVLNGT